MKVKNIFKKNQIIITALAIMIVIAGYLSFTNDDVPEDPEALQTVNPDEDEYDVFSELEGMELVTDTTNGEEDPTDSTDPTDDTDATTDDTDATAEETEEDTTAEENDETVPVETLDDDADELGELSDDEILANAQDVADNGELDLDDGIPGEAVLASTTLDAGYFSSSKLSREQVRARNEAVFKEIMDNPEVSEEAKQEAIDALIELTGIREKEDATEMLLGARGFDDAVVRITEGKVEVIVNAPDLSEQQLAIIEDVVKDKTEISIEHISIVPVIMEE